MGDQPPRAVGISSLESSIHLRHYPYMREMEQYRKNALKLAEVKYLGKCEGYTARIPGFKGLVVFADTKSGVVDELQSALEGWIELALAHGDGLPSLHLSSQELVSAH